MNPSLARFAPIAAALAIALASTAPLAQAAEVNLPDFTALVEQDGPAVVSIEAIHDGGKRKAAATQDDGGDDDMPDIIKRFFGQQGVPMPMPRADEGTAIGSGFIISADGKILTNHHVVDGADRVIVHLADRREFTAKVIGSDAMSDVALLKVQASGLPYLKLANARSLKPGQWVVAIGSPFGLDHSVTAGIVSGVGRSSLDPGQQYVPFIQTDVPINKGNSGGPLLNTKGEVVGINSQIFSMSGGYMGVSFAIPIETAMNAVTQIEATGKVRRGVLGVRIQEVTSQIASAMGLARTGGALVAQVEPGTAAARAGIKAGDLITAVDGKSVDGPRELARMIGNTQPGKEVDITLWRDGKSEDVKLTLGELKPDQKQASAEETAPQKDDTLKDFGLTVATADDGKGIVVTDVEPGSPAEERGIQAGDIITSVNSTEVNAAADFEKAIADASKNGKKAVLVQVSRDDTNRFVALPVAKG